MNPRYLKTDTPLGTMWLAARGDSLIGAWFEGQKYFPAIERPIWSDAEDPVLGRAAAQLKEYFAGERRDFDLPFAPEGSGHQRAVWAAIARVPYGETLSYGTVAQSLGRPTAARAVGAATGRNPISVFIPCHRLVAGSGALTGYAGGLPRKVALLRLEGRPVD